MRRSPLSAALVAVVAVAALAFAGGAMAYPTKPVLHPIPSTVMAITPTYTIAWDPATFDLTETYPWVMPWNYYRVYLDAFRAADPDPAWQRQWWTSGTTNAVPLVSGYRYRVKVHAVQEGWCALGNTSYQCVSPQVGVPAVDVFDVVPIPSVGIGR